MKAIIKETGQAVEVVSRFMPKKRNVPSRDWMCNLSNGTCINESELEYISDDIEGNRIIDIDNVAREYAENHYSEWEETWYDYDGYNAEPENDKLELIDAFIAGAEWQKAKMSWHSVDESLPEMDEEVIVLTDEMHGKKLLSACHISYGHRPNPDGWDGKSIFTGKVTHHDVVTYDGWNIPGVKFWMPMPKIPNEK